MILLSVFPSNSNVQYFSVPACLDCKEIIAQQKVTIILDDDLERLVDKRKKTLKEFYKKINCLVNSKGGILVIHATNPHYLDSFDQKVDDALCGQITNGALYQHVFRRFFYNKNHILFEVKTDRLSAERPLATLHVNSTISLNKGGQKLLYTQTAFLLDEFRKKAKPSTRNGWIQLQQLIEGEEVFISRNPPNRAQFQEPFQESAFLQAKFVKPNEELVGYCWRHLVEYISAFTKAEEGGSVFFGVNEEEEVNPGLRRVKFKVASVFLPENKHEDFRKSIREKITKEMMWVGTSDPEKPVEVNFRKVEHGGFVIEFMIKYYHGICFHKKEGPEVYRLIGPNSVVPKPVGVLEWIQRFGNECKMKIRSPIYTGQ
ncbi:uncharacterized protein [Littorina saxatilis]|uniref:uncharacterized protein n=1 Tax=Littorina saxatilis TaxID=31220 RepID=UPI0038B53C10